MHVSETPPEQPVDLSSPQWIHLLGIGGAGMSAIATVLAAMGHRVTGSDLKDSPGLDRLRALGIEARIGHSPDALGSPDLVARSTAIPDRNPEVLAATEAGIPVVRRATVLTAITALRQSLAVAGTHGKTTTSSMLALILMEADLKPSFIIGGDVNEIGTGAAWDESGEWFVVEADESDGTFLALDASAAIVTSVEPDHIEHYGSVSKLMESFDVFLENVDGPRIVCVDDPDAARLAAATGSVTYGTDADADHRIDDYHAGRTGSEFTIVDRHGERLDIRLPVPGIHNARNATAAVAAALELGASQSACAAALAKFGGVARRFEFRGEAADVTFVDDYAHLPSEVEAALAAAADGGWDRIVCVFQPHRYSRTEHLWSEFADSFDAADVLVVTDVYPAGEAPRPGVTGKLIVDTVLDSHPWSRVGWFPRHGELVEFLASTLRAGDLCLTLGAGDLTVVPDEVRTRLGSPT
jgi:UDP-N-acetylmuramate--alanine ligase